MKTKRIVGERDYGCLHLVKAEIRNYCFDGCGLSLGTKARSTFEECYFEDIRLRKCIAGFPIFARCVFKDLRADNSGALIYGAGFVECTFIGAMRSIVIGLMEDAVGAHEQDRVKEYGSQNVQMAAGAGFAVDVTQAEMKNVAFRGEAIVPFVRCGKDQAVILEGKSLFEKLGELGRAEPDRTKSSFFLATGALGQDRRCIATIDDETQPFLPELIGKLETKQISLRRFS